MSYGGQIGHWGILAVLFFALPLNNLAEILLVSSIFGFCVLLSWSNTKSSGSSARHESSRKPQADLKNLELHK